uniref:Uncharacterized protein n=1 Tax=Arundo donax TaxID=35708 RepID=A0A0A9FBT8_ARUDO
MHYQPLEFLHHPIGMLEYHINQQPAASDDN